MGTNISEHLYVTESRGISWGMFREHGAGFRGAEVGLRVEERGLGRGGVIVPSGRWG